MTLAEFKAARALAEAGAERHVLAHVYVTSWACVNEPFNPEPRLDVGIITGRHDATIDGQALLSAAVGVALVEFFGIVRYAEALDHVRDFPRMMRALDAAQDASRSLATACMARGREVDHLREALRVATIMGDGMRAEIERLTRELAEARAHRDEAQKTLTAISEVIGSWANVGRGLVEAVRAVVTERDAARQERAALRAMMPSAEEREAIGVAARWTLFVTPASSYVSTIDAWLSRLSPPSATAHGGENG